MNALRQIITASEESITLKIPAEFTKRKLEVIILPLADDVYSMGGKFAEENLQKLANRGKNIEQLNKLMDNIAEKAAQNGLTEAILDDILNDE